MVLLPLVRAQSVVVVISMIDGINDGRR